MASNTGFGPALGQSPIARSPLLYWPLSLLYRRAHDQRVSVDADDRRQVARNEQ